jgi:small-conductance mechanosensitive channel
MSMLFENAWAWFASGAWVASAARLLMALVIVAGAFLFARILGAGLRKLRDRAPVGAPLIYIVEKLAGYAVVLAGIFVGLSTLGVNLTSLTVFAGAVGVGVGLGLQGIVREFVSGLVVIFDPLVHVGDFVELDNGVRGEIAEVGPRATRLRTNDGLNVVIPNSKLIESQVTNWTHKGGTRRMHVPFSVAYGVDKELVREVVLNAARALSFTLPDADRRKTQVWMTGFGDSGLGFELVVWPTLDAVRRPSAMQAAYTWAIDDALKAAGIEIPYPQMDLRVRTLFGQEGQSALRTLGLEADSGPAPTSSAPGGSTNDAAAAVIDEAERDAADRAAEARGGR